MHKKKYEMTDADKAEFLERTKLVMEDYDEQIERVEEIHR